MNRNTIQAVVLATLLTLAGVSTSSANEVSLCEHWHGPANWTCGLAFGYSEAGKGSCRMQFQNGFPHWPDGGFRVNPDTSTWNEHAKKYFGKLRELADAHGGCTCTVQIRCAWMKVSSNGWVAIPSPQISNHECTLTPDSLRTMEYDQSNGRMTPNC